MGGFCKHRTDNNEPSIVLIQHRNGNQVFQCRFCGEKWPIPFQLQKLLVVLVNQSSQFYKNLDE